MRFRSSLTAAAISLCASIVWAADAYEVAGWAPADSVAVMAWAGAEQASQGFAESRMGRLWAEPSVKQFLTQPASSGWAWMREAIAEKTTPERADTIQGLLSQLWHQPVMACAFPVEKSKDWPLPVGFGVIWQTDPQSEARAKVLLGWIAEQEKKELPRRTIEGVEFTQLSVDAPVFFATRNGKWLIAFSEQAAAVMAKQGSSPSEFSASEVNRRAQQALGAGKPFYYSCFNTQAVRTTIEKEIEANRPKTTTRPTVEPHIVGLATLGAFVFLGGGTIGSQEFATMMRFDGPYIHRTSYARADKARPLPFDFLGSRPIDRTWLNEMPGDASYVSLGMWEPKQIYSSTITLIEKTLRTMGSSAPTSQPTDNLRSTIRSFLGFDPEQEILPHLGKSFAFYTQPPTGMLPSFVLVAELKDGKALQARIEKLLAKLPAGFSFQAIEVGDETMHLLILTKGGGMELAMLASPCWAITDNRLIISLQQSGARQYLENRATTQPAVPPIAQKPAIQDFLNQYKGPDLASLAYVNESGSFMPTYYQAAMFYPAMVQGLRQAAPKMQLADLPPAAVLEKHFGESVSWSTVDGDIRIEHDRAGLPILTGGVSIAKVAVGISILLPSLARARELSKRSVCAANLKGIGTGMYTYANENSDRFPPNLKTLLDAQILSPKSFQCPSACGPQLGENPTEDELAACYTYITGQTFGTDIRNLLVYEKEENHGGEGGNVLFADGHVEWLTSDKLKEAVAQTMKRLGKSTAKPRTPVKRPRPAATAPAGN